MIRERSILCPHLKIKHVNVCLMKKYSYPMRSVDLCAAPTGVLIGVPWCLQHSNPQLDLVAVLVLMKHVVPPSGLDPLQCLLV